MTHSGRVWQDQLIAAGPVTSVGSLRHLGSRSEPLRRRFGRGTAVTGWTGDTLDIASAWVVSHPGDGDAVLIAGETADERSSADCAGAARQYSGTVGGVALCQVAVTLTFATSRGHALIGRALYLPEGCAADEEHRELAGVPEEVMFATKPQLAGDLLDRAHGLGIRAAFVAGDEVYGGRQLRRSIRQRGMGYVGPTTSSASARAAP
jgi:SRSO17 transposase